MIQLDRLTKILLAAIALLLGALLLRGGNPTGVESDAYAQNRNQPLPRPQVEVKKLMDIPIKNYQEIILLGDGKTFIIRVDDGVGVYQVQEYWSE